MTGNGREGIERENRKAGSSETIQVVIADPHPLTRLGVVNLLEQTSDIAVVAECSTARECLNAIRRYDPDVAVLELRFPDGAGLDLAGQIVESGARARMAILTAEVDKESFIRSRALGVRGVVLKTMPAELLLQCVRTVHAGREFVEKDVLLAAFDELRRRAAVPKARGETLTDKEREIVNLVCAGLRNREIAVKLGISEGTVKTHLHQVYEKLGVSGRFALMQIEEKVLMR